MKLPYRVSSIKVYLWLYLPSNDNSDKIRYLHGGRSHFGQFMPFMFLFFTSIISVIRLNGCCFFEVLSFNWFRCLFVVVFFVLNLYGCDANIFRCCRIMSEWKIKMTVLNDSDFILPSEYIPLYPITKNDKTVANKLFSTTFTFDLHMAVYHLSFACLILPGSRLVLFTWVRCRRTWGKLGKFLCSDLVLLQRQQEFNRLYSNSFALLVE